MQITFDTHMKIALMLAFESGEQLQVLVSSKPKLAIPRQSREQIHRVRLSFWDEQNSRARLSQFLEAGSGHNISVSG